MAESLRPPPSQGGTEEPSLFVAGDQSSQFHQFVTASDAINTLIPSPTATPNFEALPPEVRNEIYQLVLVVTTRRERFNIGGPSEYNDTDRAIDGDTDRDINEDGDEIDLECIGNSNNTKEEIGEAGKDVEDKDLHRKGLCALFYVNKQVSSEASHILYSRNFFAIGTKYIFFDNSQFNSPPILTKARLFLERVPQRHLNLLKDLWLCLNTTQFGSSDAPDEHKETEFHSRGELADMLSLLHAKVPNVEKLEFSFYCYGRVTEDWEWDWMTGQETDFLRQGVQKIMTFESLKSLELPRWAFRANLELFMEIWEAVPTAREIIWSPSTDWKNIKTLKKATKVSLRECLERTLRHKRGVIKWWPLMENREDEWDFFTAMCALVDLFE